MASSFKEKVKEIKENLKEEDIGYMDAVGGYENIYENGLEDIRTSKSRSKGEIILPNKRLVVIWEKVFKVQFTDGGWRATDRDDENINRRNHPQQMVHPFAYAKADIKVDESRDKAKFSSYNTHERIVPPTEHFDCVPEFYGDMIYLVQLLTGRDDYGKQELMEDLKAFEDMDFDIADISKCSDCNQEIY